MQNIDRNSPIPLYYQLKTILLNKIREGEWHVGDLLPSENQLQENYDISRTTVRQTLSELVTEGYLVRKRGLGTFITEPKVTYDPSKQFELNEYTKAQGITLHWEFKDVGDYPADETIASALEIREGSNVLRIRRLRMADNRVIGYHLAYIPKTNQKYIDEAHYSEGQSLDYLKLYPALTECHIQRTLEASIVEQLDMDWLEAAPNTPILQMERIVYANDNVPIEFLVARFRGDRFKYQITL